MFFTSPQPDDLHYGMTKTAQIAIARGLAETCVGSGVTVNAILPGPTASEGVKEFVGSLAEQNKQTPQEFEKEFFKSARPTSLLQRFATPNESGALGRLLMQPAFVRDERRGAAGGWRRGEVAVLELRAYATLRTAKRLQQRERFAQPKRPQVIHKRIFAARRVKKIGGIAAVGSTWNQFNGAQVLAIGVGCRQVFGPNARTS